MPYGRAVTGILIILDCMNNEKTKPETNHHPGTLPKFSTVMQICADTVSKGFAVLLSNMYDNLDEEISALADQEENNDQHIRYIEMLQRLKTQRNDVENTFNRIVLKGFDNFTHGIIESDIPKKVTPNSVKLRLVENSDHEKNLPSIMLLTKPATSFSTNCSH